MPNVLMVGFDFLGRKSRNEVGDKIAEVARRLGESHDTVITPIPYNPYALKDGRSNPYLVVRCDDLDSAERFAKALAELGYDVEFERVHFIHAKKNPSS